MEGYQRKPPWAVATSLELRPSAIALRVRPAARSLLIRVTTSAGMDRGRPRIVPDARGYPSRPDHSRPDQSHLSLRSQPLPADRDEPYSESIRRPRKAFAFQLPLV